MAAQPGPDTGDVADRRRFHRARIPRLSGTLHSPGDVDVLDLGLAGLAFEAAAELAPGDHCFLELHHQTASVAVEVEIRWCSVLRMERLRGSFRPVFRAGGAFVEIQRDQAGGILDWLIVDPAPPAPAG
jgi:hypothetical protein